MKRLTTVFLFAVALGAQGETVTPKTKIMISVEQQKPIGTVSVAADSKTVMSADGTKSFTVPRADLSSPTLTATVSGDTYTYTLSNAKDAKAKIDMVLFPDAQFESISVDDPGWDALDTLGIGGASGGGLLPGGKSITFTAKAKAGTKPLQVAAQAYTFVAPDAETRAAIDDLAEKDTALYQFVSEQAGSTGVALQVLGPQ